MHYAMKDHSFVGVSKHRHTGWWEAHYWDKDAVNGTNKKCYRARGRQIYLGGYSTKEQAARAVDLATIRFTKSVGCRLNFGAAQYEAELPRILELPREELVAELRREARSALRGPDKYVGVFPRSGSEKFEARICAGRKRIYIGTFDTAEDAARAYDREAVSRRGAEAITNFQCARDIELEPTPEPVSSSSSRITLCDLDELVSAFD